LTNSHITTETIERVTAGDLAYYRFADWDGIKHGIFTRLGGVSSAPFDSLNLGGTVGDDVARVHDNHDLMYSAMKVDKRRTVTVWMVHGVDTVVATHPLENRRWLAQADAVITDRDDLTLVMRYADCTPIMAYDTTQGAIGIAHAGWRGTVNGMAARLIEAMVQTYGSKPGNIRAGIGPCIGPTRYQVGEEVVSAVQSRYGTLDNLVQRDPADGTAYFNLWEANRRDLQRAGVEQIDLMGICTATNTDEWFSHRAERGQTGRFGALISLG
jgi:polyphenol oxidase